MDLDREAATPLWRQLADVLAERIKSGQYAAGRRIPSEADLMAEAEVSRATVRTALAYLAEQKLTETVMGKGTYVRGS